MYIFCYDGFLKTGKFSVMMVFWIWFISCADGLVRRGMFYLCNGLVKQICILLMVLWSMYCGNGLVKQVHFYGDDLSDGLVKQVYFMVIPCWWSCEICTFSLFIVLWGTATISLVMVLWNRYIFWYYGLVKLVHFCCHGFWNMYIFFKMVLWDQLHFCVMIVF